MISNKVSKFYKSELSSNPDWVNYYFEILRSWEWVGALWVPRYLYNYIPQTRASKGQF